VPSLPLTGNHPGRPERTSLLQKVLSEVAPNSVPHKRIYCVFRSHGSLQKRGPVRAGLDSALTKLAKQYDVSDVALAKACRKLSTPLPGRGYWAKKDANRLVGPRPPLPTVTISGHRNLQLRARRTRWHIGGAIIENPCGRLSRLTGSCSQSCVPSLPGNQTEQRSGTYPGERIFYRTNWPGLNLGKS
jgi:hypothetical protein